MRKKNINFVEQIKNSENFLQKLQGIKKTSKDIKDKNKLTFHRNIWVKQFKYLSRLERQAENELQTFLQTFDQYLHYQYEEREVFKKDDYKSYKQMKDQLNNDCQVFQNKMFKQMENLPLLIQKCQNLKDQEISIGDVKAFIQEIGTLLDKTNSQLNKMQEDHRNEGNDNFLAEQYDQGYDDIVYYLKPIADEVKGFDFKKERLKKIEEGQSHLLDYLLNFQDKLSGDEISEVIEEFNHANNLLHQTLELQLQKINLDYQQILSFNHEVIRNSSSYQKFLHLYQIYVGRGKSLIQYFERLSIQFPKVSKANLENINNYIVGKIYKERKIKAAKRNFLREKEELFHKVEKEVNLRIQKKIKDAQKEAEKLMRREEKLKLQKELQILRQEYNKRQQQKRKDFQVIQQQKKAEQKKKEALRRLYLDDLSKRAEQVKQVKTQLQKKAQMEQRAKKEKEQMQKKKKIVQNQPKVQQRQSIQRKKIEKKVQVREYKQKFKQINEDRINKAIQSYPFRPKVQFSEQRLVALTQAQVIRKDTQYDKADKIQLSKATGYTINQLMGDMRFRLNAALNDAGLGQTEYARQVLLQMSRKPT